MRRDVVSARSIAVNYRITPLGRTLRAPVETLLQWEYTHRPETEEVRGAYDDRD